jgi:hypothetical protein
MRVDSSKQSGKAAVLVFYRPLPEVRAETQQGEVCMCVESQNLEMSCPSVSGWIFGIFLLGCVALLQTDRWVLVVRSINFLSWFEDRLPTAGSSTGSRAFLDKLPSESTV